MNPSVVLQTIPQQNKAFARRVTEFVETFYLSISKSLESWSHILFNLLFKHTLYCRMTFTFDRKRLHRPKTYRAVDLLPSSLQSSITCFDALKRSESWILTAYHVKRSTHTPFGTPLMFSYNVTSSLMAPFVPGWRFQLNLETLIQYMRSVKFFSKLINLFFGCFDPMNIYFLIIKINKFRGDLSSISAKTATLHAICYAIYSFSLYIAVRQ